MVPLLRYVLCLVLFNTVSLHYIIYNDYTWYYICSAWFLDIIISTCFLRKLLDMLVGMVTVYLFLENVDHLWTK